MGNRILEGIAYTRVNAGVTRARERIVGETALSIQINKRHLTTAIIIPTMVTEFIIGLLFQKRVIDYAAEITSITMKDNVAEVIIPEIKHKDKGPLVVNSDLKVNRQDIFNGVKSILKSEVFAETEAVHSAGLFRRGKELICIAEDIGRHNALDKVIGYGLLHDVDFSNTMATSTGRQPAEMVLKCLNAGIPIIATKGVPTTRAVDIAREAGVTIAGLVRGNTMIVYSNPDRIE